MTCFAFDRSAFFYSISYHKLFKILNSFHSIYMHEFSASEIWWEKSDEIKYAEPRNILYIYYLSVWNNFYALILFYENTYY